MASRQNEADSAENTNSHQLMINVWSCVIGQKLGGCVFQRPLQGVSVRNQKCLTSRQLRPESFVLFLCHSRSHRDKTVRLPRVVVLLRHFVFLPAGVG